MKNLSKSILTAVTSIGLALGFAVAPMNSASAAPVSVGTLNVFRTYDSQDGTFNVYSGEEIYLYSRFTLDMSSVEVGEVLTFAESIGQITGQTKEWTVTQSGSAPTPGGSSSTFTIPSVKPTNIQLVVTASYSSSSNAT